MATEQEPIENLGITFEATGIDNYVRDLERADGANVGFAKSVDKLSVSSNLFDLAVRSITANVTLMNSSIGSINTANLDALATAYNSASKASTGRLPTVNVPKITTPQATSTPATAPAVNAAVSSAVAQANNQALQSAQAVTQAETQASAAVQTLNQNTAALSNTMNAVGQQTQAVFTAISTDAERTSRTIVDNFGRSFDTLVANQERTLGRLALARQRVVSTSGDLTAEQGNAFNQDAVGKSITEFAQFSRTVTDSKARVSELKVELAGLREQETQLKATFAALREQVDSFGKTKSPEQAVAQAALNSVKTQLDQNKQDIKAALTDIRFEEKAAIDDLRQLGAAAGTFTDQFTNAVRQAQDQAKAARQASQELAGLKSELPATRGGVVDSVSQNIVGNIRSTVSDTGAAARKLAEAAQTQAALELQAQAEQRALDTEQAIQQALAETVGRSVDYRKAKLRELLQATQEATAAIGDSVRQQQKDYNDGVAAQESAEKRAASSAERVAAVEQRLSTIAKEEARVRNEAINKASLGSIADEAARARSAAVLEAQLNQIKALASETVTGFSEQALRDFRAFKLQIQQEDRNLKAEIKAESYQNSPTAYSKKGTAAALNLTYDEIAAKKFQQSLASANAGTRDMALLWAKVTDAIVEVRYYVETFSRAISFVKTVIDSSILKPFSFLFAPIRAVISLLEKVQGLVGKNGQDLSTFGGKFSGISPPAAPAAPSATTAHKTAAPNTQAAATIPVTVDETPAKGAIARIGDYLKSFLPGYQFSITADTQGVDAAKTKLASLQASLESLNLERSKLVSQSLAGTGGLDSQITANATAARATEAAIAGLERQIASAGQQASAQSGNFDHFATSIKSTEDAATQSATGLRGVFDQIKASLSSATATVGEYAQSYLLYGGAAQVLGAAQSFLASASSDILSALQEREGVLASLTALEQKEIANAKGYTTLAQAEGEASVKAEELYKWVSQLAIVSPFSKDAINSTLGLSLAYNFTTDNAKILTQTVVDFTAATHRGSEAQERIIRALGKVKNSGRLTAETLNQLTEAGISAIPILAKAFGLNEGKFLDAVTKGSIDAKKSIEALVGSLQKDYGGSAAKQGGTLEGLLSSLKDISNEQYVSLFEPITNAIVKPLLTGYANSQQTQESINQYKVWGENLKSFGEIVVRYFAGGWYIAKAALDVIPQPVFTFIQDMAKVAAVIAATVAAVIGLSLVLSGLGFIFGLITSPISLALIAITAFYEVYKSSLGDLVSLTGEAMALIYDPWDVLFASQLPDLLSGFYGILTEVWATINGLLTGDQATLNNFQTQFVGAFTYVKDGVAAGVEGIRGVMDGLDAIIDTGVQNAIDYLAALPEGFATVLSEVEGYGAAMIKFFAQGIVAAANLVVQALKYIGNIIRQFLQPHSPPPILPDIDKWGTSTADEWLKGWTKADIGILDEFSGTVTSFVNSIRRPDLGELSGEGQNKIKESIAVALQNFKQTGTFDTTEIAKNAGAFADEINKLGQAYAQSARSASMLELAEKQLDKVTKAYDTTLAPLQSRLQAIKDLQSVSDATDQIAEYQKVLENSFATDKQKEDARLKIEELSLQRQINNVTAEKNKNISAIQERVNLAKQENDQANGNLALIKDRIRLELAALEAQKPKAKKGGGGGEDADKKAKEKKVKEEKPINTDQPLLSDLGLQLPDATDLGGSLGDILGQAQDDVSKAFDGVKDAIKPAIDALNDLKTKVNETADAFTTGFSGGEGGAGGGFSGFAFNIGTKAAAVVLSFTTLKSGVADFITTFTAAFEGAKGGLVDKIATAFDATGVTAAVTKFQTSITTQVKNLFSGDEKGSGGLLANVSVAFQGYFTSIAWDNLGGVATSLKGGIQDSLSIIDWKAVGDYLYPLVTAIYTAIAGFDWTGMATYFGGLINAVTSAIGGIGWVKELTGKLDPLVTAVVEQIKTFDWTKSFVGVFDGMNDALLGAIKIAMSLGQGDLGGAQEGATQVGQGAKKTLDGLAQFATDLAKQLTDSIDVGVILTAAGAAIAKTISLALSSAANIADAVTSARSSDKGETTLAQQVGKVVGEAIVGIIGAIFGFVLVLVTDLPTIQKTLLSITGSIVKAISDIFFGVVQGILDSVLTLIGLAAPGWKTTTDQLKKDIDEDIGAITKVINGLIDDVSSISTVLDRVNKSVGDLLKGKEDASFALFATVRNAFFRMINGFIDAINAPANFINEQRLKLPESVQKVTPAAPLLDKIVIPVTLLPENFKVVTPAQINLSDAVKIGPEKVLLDAKNIVEINGAEKVLLDANTILGLDPTKRLTLPAGSLIEVDGKQKLAVDPKNVFAAPDGSVTITVDPAHVFKVDQAKPVDVSVPVNAKLEAAVKEAAKSPDLQLITVGAKPEITADNLVTASTITGSTDTLSINVTPAIAPSSVVTTSTLTGGLPAVDVPINITIPAATGGATGGTGGLGTDLGTSVGQGFFQGFSAYLTQDNVNAAMEPAKTAMKAFWDTGSPSKVSDEEIGQPIGQGILRGIDTALLGVNATMTTLKTQFTTTYAAIMVQTRNFSATTTQVFNKLRIDLQTLLTAMALAIIKIFTDLNVNLLKLIAKMVKDIVKLFEDMKSDVVSIVDDMADAIESDFEDIAAAVEDAADTVKTKLVNAFLEANIAILAAMDDLKEQLGKKLDDIILYLQSATFLAKFSNVGLAWGKAIGNSIADGINAPTVKGALSTAISTLVKFLNDEFVRKIAEGGDGGGGGGGGTPGKALGTNYASGATYLTGEHGQELITPARGSQIFPASTTRSILDVAGMIASNMASINSSPYNLIAKSVAQPMTTVIAPVTNVYNNTLVMQVTPGQVEAVSTNFGIMNALIG